MSAVFPELGIVMEMTIVVMEQMNQMIVTRKEEPALVICLLVVMETVYQKFIFVMVIMIVLMAQMKTKHYINVVSN